jgi:hypothetical protein
MGEHGDNIMIPCVNIPNQAARRDRHKTCIGVGEKALFPDFRYVWKLFHLWGNEVAAAY